jgi:MoxR-like ATPase
MSEKVDIRELNERIEKESAFVTNLMAGMDQVIVGQKHLIESLLIGLLSDGHILLEGVPGLAKTLAIKTLASLIDADFNRIQFTPDLLPADVIGTMIYSQKEEVFIPKKGPVFANFILADEINRAPAKVQSALLEAMQDRLHRFESSAKNCLLFIMWLVRIIINNCSVKVKGLGTVNPDIQELTCKQLPVSLDKHLRVNLR